MRSLKVNVCGKRLHLTWNGVQYISGTNLEIVDPPRLRVSHPYPFECAIPERPDNQASGYPILRMVATNRAAFAHRRRQRITLAHGRRVPAPTCPSIQMYANVYTDGESNGKNGRTSAQACRGRHRAP